MLQRSGLPPEADGWDSDTDSEYEDEDDEDSNGKRDHNWYTQRSTNQTLPLIAEDWYTNDYPDEEESDEESDGTFLT